MSSRISDKNVLSLWYGYDPQRNDAARAGCKRSHWLGGCDPLRPGRPCRPLYTHRRQRTAGLRSPMGALGVPGQAPLRPRPPTAPTHLVRLQPPPKRPGIFHRLPATPATTHERGCELPARKAQVRRAAVILPHTKSPTASPFFPPSLSIKLSSLSFG